MTKIGETELYAKDLTEFEGQRRGMKKRAP